ncbi:hypothetical protein BT96DRAFT_387410 [Gymnopus androsaceus JB14]|uniref:Uncharacterized protein n=1 Tax=Gymnopus androsaceus JB14 TaxID=1447944 RepID=A0A6A4I8I0_9AGAR|nr:hypothetical protein BT96DRAFT_387410 [Gymnopus androsaceus JB14]
MKFPTFRSVTSSLSTILIGILLVTVHAAPSPQVPRKIDDSVNDKKAAFSSALNLADNELGSKLKLEGTDNNKIYELRGQTYKAKSSHAVESYPLQTLLLRILTEVNDDAQREVDALKAAEAFVDSGTFRIGTDPAKACHHHAQDVQEDWAIIVRDLSNDGKKGPSQALDSA